MNFRDVELLSAYVDGRLSPPDSARLEKRLASDATLKAQLEDLRATRAVLRRLPQRRAPRNFRLTPKMAGVRPPEPRAYPMFRVATALATFLFVMSVALNGLVPLAASHLAAAPAPMYGMGGGAGGGGPAESTGPAIGGGDGSTEPAAPAAPAATEAPVQPFAALAPTATAEAVTQDSSRNSLPAPTEEASKAAPVPPRSGPAATQQPVPAGLVIALGVMMIVFAAGAWLLRRGNERRIREQWNRK